MSDATFCFEHIYFYRSSGFKEPRREEGDTVYAYQLKDDPALFMSQLKGHDQVQAVRPAANGVFVDWNHDGRTPTFVLENHWLVFAGPQNNRVHSPERFAELHVSASELADNHRDKDETTSFNNPVTREVFSEVNKRIISLVGDGHLTFPFDELELMQSLQEELMDPEGEWLNIAAYALIAHAVKTPTPGQYIEADNSTLLDDLADDANVKEL